ncbi:rhomboid family intramembrane serine protease [Rubellimicrobium sp. CFH 75288]|uniref:rhomboid family intramembrane serine protease n=1 Tax=Rubellimicrobium sp. CFH 75288 TaxID=2697034 RepID=UPI0014120D7B|nr:rhomboid family intramembrane serine protease [Rubellimicrobium sp. CFH 75288]NAZ38337.1 rhomboid family intramembrane serine protease [Rubellimicrobium sp. CFH 75288]
MLPYQDSVATRYPPVVVWLLIAACVLAFLHQVSLPPRILEVFLFHYALVPARFLGDLRSVAPGDPVVFLTNMFLHGGWLHLILNMWTLWIFGPAVEDRLGSGRFLAFYLVCGLAAGLAHAFANPDSVVPALGASGAIAGVIGCYARMFPAARLVVMIPIVIIPIFVEVRAAVFALVWFAMQAVPGLLSLGQDADAGGIAWWAHIGGFAAGWLLAPLVRRSRRRYRPHYRDEGIYGFLPDGRRSGGRGPWG